MDCKRGVLWRCAAAARAGAAGGAPGVARDGRPTPIESPCDHCRPYCYTIRLHFTSLYTGHSPKSLLFKSYQRSVRCKSERAHARMTCIVITDVSADICLPQVRHKNLAFCCVCYVGVIFCGKMFNRTSACNTI